MGTCFLYGKNANAFGTRKGLTILRSEIRPEEALPNTVWVDAEAASGEYLLSANEPEGKEGLLWLRTGDGGVQVILDGSFPLVLLLSNAYVFHDEKWSAVNQCDVYTETGWETLVEPPMRLYSYGELCEKVSGGWSTADKICNNPSFAPEYLADRVFYTSDTTRYAGIFTNEMICVDDFRSVTVDWSAESATDSFPKMTLYLSFLDDTKQKKLAEFEFGSPGERRVDHFSIGELTGSYHLSVRVRSTHSAASTQKLKANLYMLQLERYGVDG